MDRCSLPTHEFRDVEAQSEAGNPAGTRARPRTARGFWGCGQRVLSGLSVSPLRIGGKWPLHRWRDLEGADAVLGEGAIAATRGATAVSLKGWRRDLCPRP